MITQEQLIEMSDFEINKTVADVAGIEFRTSGRHVIPADQIRCDTLDYCNNPNDIMPIAFENKIALFPLGKTWKARKQDVMSRTMNPLRAICEAYILMNQ